MIIAAVWSYEKALTKDNWTDTAAVPITKAPPCVRLYDYLQVYSEKYGVPFCIAYGVAKAETGYDGPFHWTYKPNLVSSAAAYGAMQIQVPTANFIWRSKQKVNSKRLLNDLEFNVETSMKLLAYLKERYGSWEVALGCYNTGRPIVNSYAVNIVRGCNP